MPDDAAVDHDRPKGIRDRLGITPEEWRRRTEWPITITALVFLVVYAWDVLADLSGWQYETAEWIMWTIWLVFLVDYVMNLLLAERRWHWFYTHLPQFFVVALPILRPLRLLRLAALWGLLQRAAGAWVRGSVTVYVIGSASLLVFIASLAELEAERHYPGAEITTYSDSLWWVFETITTVGYGDKTPKSFEGRAIAVGLMIAGIALLGVITATIASWMVERVSRDDSKRDQITLAHVDALSEQVTALSAQISALQRAQSSPSASGTAPSAAAPTATGQVAAWPREPLP